MFFLCVLYYIIVIICVIIFFRSFVLYIYIFILRIYINKINGIRENFFEDDEKKVVGRWSQSFLLVVLVVES